MRNRNQTNKSPLLFATHIEAAARLGVTPSAVVKMIKSGQFRDYGFLGGVYLLPAQEGPNRMDFFPALVALRHDIGGVVTAG